jgi:glycerol uptake facilitator-like aquaporin
MTLLKKLTAEAIGTAFLLSIVVGSGIMAERLASGNVAIALLANAIVTGVGLFTLIVMFVTLSGAHFNPVVSLVSWLQNDISTKEALAYMVVQIIAAVIGVMMAHAMFDLPSFTISEHSRTGSSQWFSEFVATFGLIAVIISTVRINIKVMPAAVACYITAAYWFTASTSFANPAVTIARSLTNTFAGIKPNDVFGFIAAQIAGAVCAYYIFNWLFSTQIHLKDEQKKKRTLYV